MEALWQSIKLLLSIALYDYIDAVMMLIGIMFAIGIAWLAPYLLVVLPLKWYSRFTNYNPLYDKSRRITLLRIRSSNYPSFRLNLKRQSHIHIVHMALFSINCLVGLWSTLKRFEVGSLTFLATFGISGTIGGYLWLSLLLPSLAYIRLKTSCSFDVGQRISCVIDGIKIRMIVIYESQLSTFGVQLDENTGLLPAGQKLYYYEIPNAKLSGVTGYEGGIDLALIAEIERREQMEEYIELHYAHVMNPPRSDGLLVNHIINPNQRVIPMVAPQGSKSNPKFNEMPPPMYTQATMNSRANTHHEETGDIVVDFYGYYENIPPGVLRGQTKSD